MRKLITQVLEAISKALLPQQPTLKPVPVRVRDRR